MVVLLHIKGKIMTIDCISGLLPEYSIILAKNILADFLKRSADDICCDLLTGGSVKGGLVKCNYGTESYVIKFFSAPETGLHEIAWTRHAADLGIGPQFFSAEPTGKYMITEFVHGNALVPAIANTPSILKSIAKNLSKLHRSSALFAQSSDCFTRIDEKYKKLNCSGALKSLLEQCYQQVKKIEAHLQDATVPFVPCHNDLNWGNIFVHNNHVTFIDWG